MSTLPPNTNPSDRIAAVILIGGHGRRMGQDKARLKLGATTFLGHLVNQLGNDHYPTLTIPTPTCDPIYVVGRPDQRGLTPPGCTFVVDEILDRGPLAGLMSGLKAASKEREIALVLSVDTPLFPIAVLSFYSQQLGTADAAIPWDGHRLYGLSALYRTSIAVKLGAMLDGGQSRIQDLPNRIEVARISLDDLKQVDPQLLSITGANTPEEYAKLFGIHENQRS